MKTILCSVLMLSLCSCSLFSNRDKERELQTEILSNITQKAPDFAKCARKSDIFKHFNQERLRVVLHLSINPSGQVEKFRLDDKNYPESFAECTFNIVDTLSFPKFETHQLIELDQPFIFSKK